MGCRLSKSYLTIIESPSNSGMNNQSIESVKDAHELINFLRDENHSNYKCIFIFGKYWKLFSFFTNQNKFKMS